jgi:tRNA-2-methylthio-N6-dimethylallyladenosine synthase
VILLLAFLGESDDDFNDTIKLIKDIGFDKSFSYIYSQRPGTPASSMIDDVSLDIKKQRLTQLQKIIDDKTLEITNSMVGSVQKVLVERVSKKSGKLFGKTENMRNTHFDGDESLIGKVVSVKIDSGFANSLSGSLIVD